MSDHMHLRYMAYIFLLWIAWQSKLFFNEFIGSPMTLGKTKLNRVFRNLIHNLKDPKLRLFENNAVDLIELKYFHHLTTSYSYKWNPSIEDSLLKSFIENKKNFLLILYLLLIINMTYGSHFHYIIFNIYNNYLSLRRIKRTSNRINDID